MNLWTRTASGTYVRDGWTIRRQHSKGSGQSKPFRHVSVKAYDAWVLYTPDGINTGVGASTLANAKLNADRQIALRGQV